MKSENKDAMAKAYEELVAELEQPVHPPPPAHGWPADPGYYDLARRNILHRALSLRAKYDEDWRQEQLKKEPWSSTYEGKSRRNTNAE